MRTQIADRDLQIDEFKLTVAELQQKLIDEGQNEKIINDLRLNIETIAAERDNNAMVSETFFLAFEFFFQNFLIFFSFGISVFFS